MVFLIPSNTLNRFSVSNAHTEKNMFNACDGMFFFFFLILYLYSARNNYRIKVMMKNFTFAVVFLEQYIYIL